MSRILFFDTETTGLIAYKDRSHAEHQPHMVDVAGILCDSETRKVEDSFEAIIKPDGWIIPNDTIEIHGITNEEAADVGISEVDALTKFLYLFNQLDECDLRVAHNTTFDNRIIRIALKRYLPDAIGDDQWKDKDKYYCTLVNSRRIMGGKSGHKLSQAYEHFVKKEMVEAHRAMPDAQACMEIYFAIQDQENEDKSPL